MDCGGPCRACELKSPAPLSIFWARAGMAGPNAYDSIALVENPNQSLSSAKVEYEFILLDELGIIGRRTGETYIYSQERLYVIEPNIETSREALRVEFRVTHIEWQLNQERPPVFIVERREHSVVQADGVKQSMVEAQFLNVNPLDFREVETSVVVFDTDGNLIGANRILTENLSAGSRGVIKSIWPGAFGGVVGKIEVIPRVNLFDSDVIIRPR